jgi:phenylpropionate dioxygenase-like ring-hydroxylating dioxygenase large terminal subunit
MLDKGGLAESNKAASHWTADLVDVRRREVKLAIHADPGVFQREMDAIFAKTWNFVAHVSEIPNPRDFVTRYIGRDPVIVCRQLDGSVRVMLNSCTHKGALICRADKGRTNSFLCPYHGFTFRPDGTLSHVPLEAELYGPDFDHREYSLTTARVEEVTGFVFANWDPNAPGLREYLGGYSELLETAFARTDAGMEVIGPPQRWIIESNWKLAPEQFAGDGYHAVTSHASLGPRQMQVDATNGIDISINGHGARCIGASPMTDAARKQGGIARIDAASALRALPPAGMNNALVEEFIARGRREHVQLAAECPPTVGTIFPNFMWLCVNTPDPNTGALFGMHDIRIMRPLGPAQTELWSWALVERDLPLEQKNLALAARTFYFSPGGAVERDDIEMWTRIQSAAAGAVGRRSPVRYRALTKPDRDDLFPGLKTWRGWSAENTAWEYMLRWRAFMANELW